MQDKQFDLNVMVNHAVQAMLAGDAYSLSTSISDKGYTIDITITKDDEIDE